MEGKWSEGSPTRVRGKADKSVEILKEPRITPACAGKSKILLPLLQNHKDHPRVCGEKQEKEEITMKKVGITPACAGKSSGFGKTYHANQDHPRVCGEKTKKSP